MPTRSEKALPWSGAVAAVCWVGQDALQRHSITDEPGAARFEVIRGHLALNYASIACLVVMGMALLVFATSTRNLLRSGEPAQATYSSIAHAGWVVTVAGLSQMVAWSWALVNGAADDHDDAALHVLSYVSYFGWAAMGIGLATAFIATGLGGLRNALLPRWFAVITVACGVLGALGNAGIPPGGLVTYLLLPPWLVTASVLLSQRLSRSPSPGLIARTDTTNTHP